MALALDEAQLAEIRAILAAHLPPEIDAGVFGSRAGGAVKRFSDLDLVLQGDDVLPLSLLATLAEAFDESSLPFKVDLVDRLTLSEAFGAIVDAARRPFPR